MLCKETALGSVIHNWAGRRWEPVWGGGRGGREQGKNRGQRGEEGDVTEENSAHRSQARDWRSEICCLPLHAVTIFFFDWWQILSVMSHIPQGGIYGSFLQANPRADLWKVFIPSWVRVPKTKGMKQFKQVRKYLMTRVLGKRTGCDSRKRGRRFYVSISSIFFSFKWSAALNPFYSCLRALGSHFNTLHTPHFNQPLLCLLKIHTGGIF